MGGVRGRRLDGVAGFIESLGFYPHLTGRQDLEGLALLDGGTPTGPLEQVLDGVEMSDRSDQKVGGESYGMRLRFGVAASLLRELRPLVLDEPNALDPTGIPDMRATLQELSETAAMIVIGSSGGGPVASLLLGSVTISVSKHAICPVVVHRSASSATTRHGVLVGVNGSADSLPATSPTGWRLGVPCRSRFFTAGGTWHLWRLF